MSVTVVTQTNKVLTNKMQFIRCYNPCKSILRSTTQIGRRSKIFSPRIGPSLLQDSALNFKRYYAKPSNPIKTGKLEDEDDLDFDDHEFEEYLRTGSTRNSKNQKVTITEPGEEEGGNTITESQMEDLAKELAQETPWLKKFNSSHSESTKTETERIEFIQQHFLRKTAMGTLQDMPPDLITKFFPYLIKFGDMFLKDAVMDDPDLRAIYQSDADDEGPVLAYITGCLQLLKGEQDVEVIRTRLKLPRLQDNVDQDLYSELKAVLSNKSFDEFNEDPIRQNSNKVNKLLELYQQLPTPKASNFMAEDLEEFLEFIGKNMDGVDIRVMSDLYEDVLQSGMLLTSSEMTKWLLVTLNKYNTFDEDTYTNLKNSLKQMGYATALDKYNLFLSACLNSNNLELFDKILVDIDSDSIDPNRETLNLMQKYTVLKDDFNMWLNLMELRIEYLPFFLENEDLKDMMLSLIMFNQRDLAKDVLNIYLTIQELYKAHHNIPEDEVIENKNKTYIPYEEPLELFDLVVDEQDLVMFYPHLSGDVFEPLIDSSPELDEILTYFKTMRDYKITITIDSYRSLFQCFNENKNQLSFKQLQDIVFGLINDKQTEFLLTDEFNLSHFVDIIEFYTELGELDGDNDTIVQSLTNLYKFLEDPQHYQIDEKSYMELANSVVYLTKLQTS